MSNSKTKWEIEMRPQILPEKKWIIIGNNN